MMNASTKGFLVALVLTAAAPMPARSDEPNAKVAFYKDIVPILQNNCQTCHRPSGSNMAGMVAPMSLISYEEVRPWAKSIAQKVRERKMPPWFAAPQFNGVFELERRLSDKEIETLVRWSQTGALRGSPGDAPKPAVFASAQGWTMGEPDLIVKLPKPYWVADDVEDIQPSFAVDLGEDQLPEDRWIHWIEFRPGSKVVHHGGARVQPLDKNGKPVVDPISGGKIIGTAPGDGPDVWPEGYGKLVRRGSRIIFNIHYHKEKGAGTGAWDQSMIAIKWHTNPVKYVVRAAGISSRGWEIPPQHNNWRVGATRTFEQDSMLINLMPHMHLRGKAARYDAVYPNGARETLLDVPGYDYNWQMTYTFKKPKFIPAGTRLEVSMWFNNSSENSAAPDPDRPIGFGSMTVDEMNIGWTEYANATPIEDLLKADFGKQGTGVEDIDIDSIEGNRAAALRLRSSIAQAAGAQPKLTLSGKSISIRYAGNSLGPEQLTKAREGEVVTLTADAAIKLMTEADLRFGEHVIKAGNFNPKYAGVYSLWLKKTGNGWRLVFNKQADVLGTQHDPAADVLELPLAAGTSPTEAKKLTIELKKAGDEGLLRLAWGSNEWTAKFTVVTEH